MTEFFIKNILAEELLQNKIAETLDEQYVVDYNMIASEILIKNLISEILFNKSICESLENQYTVNYVYNVLLESRLLYGEPVTVPELRKLLRKKIVNFEFIKLDGEVRPARGTTMMKYIPQKDHPKGIRPSSPKVATFFDMKKKEWRSVSQRSKEIVLDKDEETGKPVVKVTDKGAAAPGKEKFEIGDVYQFTKIGKVKYKSGESKQVDIPTYITITRKTEDGYWGKTAGSEIDILLTPDRIKRLGEPIRVGDKYEFAKLDKNRKKVFTTIEITRKTDDGFWGKTEGSKQDILLTNDRLKRLHSLEVDEIPVEKEPEQPEITISKSEEKPDVTIDGKSPEEFIPELEPEEPQKPFVTIDGLPAEPLEEPLVNVEPVLKPGSEEIETEEPETEKEKKLPKIKPIEKGEITKKYHFRNPQTGAGLDLDISPKDTIKKLKELGANWYLITDKEYEKEQEHEEPEIPENPEKKIKPIVPEKKPIINKNKNLGNIEADQV
jgi:hypothetical protein